MKEIDQIKAFGKIYEQNPLSPVLTFYGGLTKLTSDIIRAKLCLALSEQSDIHSIMKPYFNYKPTSDVRRKLLALVNCVYESQRNELFSYIELEEREPPPPSLILQPVEQIEHPEPDNFLT